MNKTIEPWTDGSTVPGATYVDLPAPAVKAELAAEEKRAVGLLEILGRHMINSPESADQVGAILKDTNDRIKVLEAQRKEVKAPALLATKEIDGFFRPATAALKKTKAKALAMIGDWTREQERARAVTIAAVAAKAAPPTMIAPVTQAPQGVAYRNVIEVRVTDASKVPREYTLVNHAALQKLADAGGDAPPGVVFERVSKPIVGRG